MKPLPHFITDDEFFLATEAQRTEWNARIAMGTEPDEPEPACNYPNCDGGYATGYCHTDCRKQHEPKQLPLLCTLAERDAATPEQVKDWDQRLMQQWREDRESKIAADTEWDRKFSFLGE